MKRKIMNILNRINNIKSTKKVEHSFKNIKEIEDYVKSNLNIPIVNLDGMDIKICELMIDTIEDFFTKYPYFKNTICGIVQVKDVNYHINLLANADKDYFKYGMDFYTYNLDDVVVMSAVKIELIENNKSNIDIAYITIVLNNILNTNYNDLKKETEKDVNEGYHPKNCYIIKSHFYHELGHVFDFILDISTKEKFKKIIENQNIKEKISEYATIGNSDCFAEAFSEYHCSKDKANQLVKDIVEFGIEEYKNLNRKKIKTLNLAKKYRF